MRWKGTAGGPVPAKVIFRQPAMIAEDQAAPGTFPDRTGQFAPAVPADPEVGVLIILVKPEAAVVFRQVMAKTKGMAAPLARERDLLKDLSAILAPAHYVCIVGRE